MMDTRKDLLDKAIALNSLATVGNGYGDIIVSKNKLRNFVNELNSLDLKISELTWWCLCQPANKHGCHHGAGGPGFVDGYFSELCDEFDQFETTLETVEEHNQNIVKFIENKIYEHFNGSRLEYKNSCLHPAIWLSDVPSTWKNGFTRGKYELKLYFEWGGGFLWCQNDHAHDLLGVGPTEDKLLSRKLVDEINDLTALHDTALNWDYPPDPGPWSEAQYLEFEKKAQDVLSKIQREVGTYFNVSYKRLGWFE